MISKKLSTKKRKFISLINNQEINNLETNALINEIGISKSTYYRWLNDRELSKIIVQENAPEINERLPEIIKTLVKNAVQGDIRATKIFLEIHDNNKDGKNVTDGLTPYEIITIIRIARNVKNDKDNKN